MLQKLLFIFFIFNGLPGSTATLSSRSFAVQQSVAVSVTAALKTGKAAENQILRQRDPQQIKASKSKWKKILDAIIVGLAVVGYIGGLLAALGGLVGLVIALVKWSGVIALWSLGALAVGTLVFLFCFMIVFNGTVIS